MAFKIVRPFVGTDGVTYAAGMEAALEVSKVNISNARAHGFVERVSDEAPAKARARTAPEAPEPVAETKVETPTASKSTKKAAKKSAKKARGAS